MGYKLNLAEEIMIVEMYKGGATIESIHHTLNCSRLAIRMVLNKNDIHILTKSNTKDEIFRRLDNEKDIILQRLKNGETVDKIETEMGLSHSRLRKYLYVIGEKQTKQSKFEDAVCYLRQMGYSRRNIETKLGLTAGELEWIISKLIYENRVDNQKDTKMDKTVLDKITTAYTNGMRIIDICNKFNLSNSTVCSILAKHCDKYKERISRDIDRYSLNREIIEYRKNEKSIDFIVKRLNTYRQYVINVVNREIEIENDINTKINLITGNKKETYDTLLVRYEKIKDKMKKNAIIDKNRELKTIKIMIKAGIKEENEVKDIIDWLNSREE